MTLIFNRVLEFVTVQIRAKFHQAKCSGSWVIVLKKKEKKREKGDAKNNTAVASAGSNKIKTLVLRPAELSAADHGVAAGRVSYRVAGTLNTKYWSLSASSSSPYTPPGDCSEYSASSNSRGTTSRSSAQRDLAGVSRDRDDTRDICYISGSGLPAGWMSRACVGE